MWVLDRTYFPDRTEGLLHVYHGKTLKTIEQEWLGNERRVSCIPEGRYTVLRDLRGHHTWYAFRDAETNPRSAIEFHPGSKPEHSQGCILLSRLDLEILLGMAPNGDKLWIRSETGPIDYRESVHV